MTFAQRRNCLTMHFSESIRVVKRHMTVLVMYHRVVLPSSSGSDKSTAILGNVDNYTWHYTVSYRRWFESLARLAAENSYLTYWPRLL